MLKSKKGVTVVSVLIIIVVLSVLSSGIILSTNAIMNNTYKKEFKNEYYLVKSAVNDYIMRNSGELDFEETEIDLSNVSNQYLTQFDGETKTDNKIEAYVVDLDKVGVYNTTYGNKLDNDDDVYVVTKEKHTVYYKKGFDSNDFVYYKAIED